jgi:hypothetical protein
MKSNYHICTCNTSPVCLKHKSNRTDINLPRKQCVACNGKGYVLDDLAIGRMLQKLREDNKVRIVDLSIYMHISQGMLSRLEHGGAVWELNRIKRYINGVEELSYGKCMEDTDNS